MFNEIIGKIQLESLKLQRNYRATPEELACNSIDIEKFIKVLYTILDLQGFLLNGLVDEEGFDKGTDRRVNQEIDKFFFAEEYPDMQVEDRNILTWEIVKRTPAALSSNEEPHKGTKYYRPLMRGQPSVNKLTGGIEADLFKLYDNTVRFKVWSKSSGHAERLASWFENYMDKYYYFFRRYVPVILYQGRVRDSRTSGDFGQARFFEIPLDFFIRTEERFVLTEDELKIIEVNLPQINSIISGEEPE